MTARAGMTLVELLVVIAILGMMTALSSVAIGRLDARHAPDPAEELRALKRDAVRARHPITRLISHGSLSVVVTALPDGRVAADTLIPFTLVPSTVDAVSH